jgi:hypothetical protein
VLALATHLDNRWPDAAGSLREGLDEMFTVRRLGVSERLAASLTCTNAIESMISICRDTARHVKRWRDGKMVRRWVAAGMLNAERSFRRIKGCKDMPILVAALRAHAARAARSPPWLRRCRRVLPEEAGIGATPHRWANAASDRSRWGLSPAVTSSCAAVHTPTPETSRSAGAA